MCTYDMYYCIVYKRDKFGENLHVNRRMNKLWNTNYVITCNYLT